MLCMFLEIYYEGLFINGKFDRGTTGTTFNAVHSNEDIATVQIEFTDNFKVFYRI